MVGLPFGPLCCQGYLLAVGTVHTVGSYLVLLVCMQNCCCFQGFPAVVFFSVRYQNTGAEAFGYFFLVIFVFVHLNLSLALIPLAQYSAQTLWFLGLSFEGCSYSE